MSEYNEHINYYGALYSSPELRRHVKYDEYIDKCVSVATRTLKLCSTDTVLDIGSGLGDTGKILSSRVNRVYCCDIDVANIELGNRNINNIENISYDQITARPPFLSFIPDNHIDKAYAHNVFEYRPTEILVTYLEELARVLKVGGMFHTVYSIRKTADHKPSHLEDIKGDIDSAIQTLNYDTIRNEEYIGNPKDIPQIGRLVYGVIPSRVDVGNYESLDAAPLACWDAVTSLMAVEILIKKR